MRSMQGDSNIERKKNKIQIEKEKQLVEYFDENKI